MTQTQVDLPPISIARYLELLKRRRWQVVPMTLLGLLVGVVVAFLIPRYYVASTTVVYRGLVLDKDSRTQADPLFAEVNNAELSIPAMVVDALEKLEWISSDASHPARDGEIEAVTGRLEVNSYNDEDRGYTNISIEYRDTDGEKSAAFANTLRSTWIELITDRVLERARSELEGISNTVRRRLNAVQLARRELRNHASEHRLDQREEDGEAGAEGWLYENLREEQGLEAELTDQVETLRKQTEGLSRRLDEGLIPRYLQVRIKLDEDLELRRLLTPLLNRQAYLQHILKTTTPAHAEHLQARSELPQIERQIAMIAPSAVGDGELTKQVENPRWTKNQERLDQKLNELEVAETRLVINQKRLDLLEKELKDMPEIYEIYKDLQGKLQTREAQYNNALDRQDELEQKYKKAQTGQPFDTVFQATVPPAPTEPNLTVVALTGGFLGLAAAIGLVLLLDFLRSNFKTVDDVQYVLSVPVLGVMAFLETDAERVRVARQRRRVSIAAATFLVLSLSLVTVYYVDPARLPPMVLRALDLLLGSTR